MLTAWLPMVLRELLLSLPILCIALGSFYYLAFALGQAEFNQPETLWVTVCLVVLVSRRKKRLMGGALSVRWHRSPSPGVARGGGSVAGEEDDHRAWDLNP